MIDLEGIRALVAVDTMGTVAAAADTLGFTPSGVSQQVKRLERQLGLPVLERVGRGVILTPAGAALAREGRQLLEDADTLAARVRQQADSLNHQVTLAAFSTAVRGIVAPAVARLAISTPQLDLTVLERDPADAADLVAQGRASLALVHNWVGLPLHLPAGLRSRLLGTDVADILVHKGHRLAGRAHVTPEDLITERWVSTDVGTICHAWFRQMFAGFPRPPQVSYWAGEFQSHLRYVECGAAVSLVPRLGRGPLPEGVVALPVQDPVPTREIEAIWRSSSHAHPAIQRLVEEFALISESAKHA